MVGAAGRLARGADFFVQGNPMPLRETSASVKSEEGMLMKVYVMTDMEGISGVSIAEMVQRGQPQYEAARHWLTSDVNAAVAGAFDGGATEVIVNDGHGGAPHLVLDEADPRALYERPNGGADCFPSLDQSCACILLVGAHARAGTMQAFLDHTQSSIHWFDYRVNGVSYGEIGQVAIWGGALGVPVTLVTGDEAACREAREELSVPVTVEVKRAVCRNYARCLHPARAAELIRQGAARAVQLAKETPPFVVPPPLTVEVTFTRCDYADSAAQQPHVERVDARTVRTIVDHGTKILMI